MTRLLHAIALLMLLAACGSLPTPTREMAFSTSPVSEPSAQANVGKVVFLNELPVIFQAEAFGTSILPGFYLDRDMWKIGGMGTLNLSLSGKSAGQLQIGEFLQLELPYGEYELSLLHNAPFDVVSKHTIRVDRPWSLQLVFARDFTNTTERFEGRNTRLPAKYVELK
jgi:hypothetical protein